MTAGIAVTIVAVLALWAVAAFAVWYWGPGLRRRTVWCPVFKMHANIVTEQKEGGFEDSYAGLAVMDVKRCSLFKGQAVRCEKDCLQNP